MRKVIFVITGVLSLFIITVILLEISKLKKTAKLEELKNRIDAYLSVIGRYLSCTERRCSLKVPVNIIFLVIFMIQYSGKSKN